MKKVVLLAVGDITLQTNNGLNPFENVVSIFEKKDILFGNLETVLSYQGKKAKKSVVLNSSPITAKYLKEADFDILNVANNHILDLGLEGLNNTLNTLDNNKLNYTGVNCFNSGSIPVVLEKNDIKLGFLGYTIGRFKQNKQVSLCKLDEKRIIKDIIALKEKCDIVVVSLHWGTENVFYPSPNQIDIAHRLIDSGAALILGHHPHVLQGIEKYNGGLIVYSLGNFQFDSKLSQSKTNDSIILSVSLNENGVLDHEIIPVVIDDNFMPLVVEGKAKNRVINSMKEFSKPLINNKITGKWWFEEIGREYLVCNLNSYATRIKTYGLFPLLECCFWLLTPFCLRCYMGILRSSIRRFVGGMNR
jgi:poly-gamma-glutamate synthesis protein (capsule biosynthesis protein)